tara:strand:- start:1840 stop:1965 length:126 start_codon:yes stop_codon:yes gene_type:complete
MEKVMAYLTGTRPDIDKKIVVTSVASKESKYNLMCTILMVT